MNDELMNMKYPFPEMDEDFPDAVLRSAQFAPFAALTGHDEAIAETARLTDEKLELDEYTKQELNGKLNLIAEFLEDEPMITFTYFVPDDKKSGGKYIKATGIVNKIREFEREVILDDGTIIPIDDILEIDGEIFNEIYE